MNIENALALINKEYDDDDGLLILFRMSADVKEDRLDAFLAALQIIQDDYIGKNLIEKKLVYRIVSFYQVLNASRSHWKVSRPEGLTRKVTSDILMALMGIFATN